MDGPQVQEKTEGESKEETVKKAEESEKPDPAEDRIAKINEAADRLEAAEKRLAERESSLREAEALGRLGGTTNAGQAKLTPEEEKQANAQKAADEISSAFK